MIGYNVILAQPANYPHSMALWDIGRLLHYSFASLGRTSTLRINELDSQAVNVLLGYHLVAAESIPKGYDCIIYQLEQLSDKEGWFNATRLAVLQRAREIWDFSPDNIAFLKGKGLNNLKLLPIGFHEALRAIPHATQDVDVLFYGSMNARRQKIFDELRQRCRLETIYGLYGAQRDAWIARAKIVLNVHYYQTKIMEQVRVSYLLNNGCCVISEDSPANPFSGMIADVAYEQITQTCLDYLKNTELRENQAQRGLELFRQRPMVECLRRVLD
ncbi:MAG TPA: hypothetical protein VMG59_05715 [Phycisphaerae bacterium]|nr:hypothetical protein [Phycisphaerae bacterium]